MQNMLLRKAIDQDREAIVALLTSSLGNISSPKSIANWTWKHEHNPFGKSEVMVSAGDDSLSGIRAMMPWVWQAGQQQFQTYRAVDTATHPTFKEKVFLKNSPKIWWVICNRWVQISFSTHPIAKVFPDI